MNLDHLWKKRESLGAIFLMSMEKKCGIFPAEVVIDKRLGMHTLTCACAN